MRYSNILVILILLTGCSTKPEVIIQKQVEYIKPPLITCPIPEPDKLQLREYEFKVLPSLRSLGVSEARIQEWYESEYKIDLRYLSEDLDQTWWAVDSFDFQDIDLNDVDKLKALRQAIIIGETLSKCITEHNQRLQLGDSPGAAAAGQPDR